MRLDPRLFCNPAKWEPAFHESDLLSFQNVILKLIAMIPIDFDRFFPPKFTNISTTLHRLIFLSLSLLILHVNFLFIYEFFTLKNGTLEQVTYLITMTIISSFTFFNIFYYQLAHKQYLNIAKYFNGKFLHRSAMGVTCVTGEPAYLFAKRFSFFWSLACFSGTFQWVVVALFMDDRVHPLRVNYPWIDQRQTPYYQIIFVMHAACQFITGISFANISNVLLSLAVIICGQFDVLFCSLKNVRNTAMTFNGGQLKELK